MLDKGVKIYYNKTCNRQCGIGLMVKRNLAKV